MCIFTKFLNKYERICKFFYKTFAAKTILTMNFNGKIFGNFKEIYTAYETMKRRQSGKQVCSASESCGNNTNCFLRDGQWMGPGGRSGCCGSEKDHRRVYLCEGCYKKRQRK